MNNIFLSTNYLFENISLEIIKIKFYNKKFKNLL
jgi:hypothetical protein